MLPCPMLLMADPGRRTDQEYRLSCAEVCWAEGQPKSIGRMIGCVRCQHRSAQSMPEAQNAQAVQLLDLMLEHFAEDGHWTRGRYDDGNGGHCLVGALLHLSRKHRLPRAPAIALLQDAMPRPGLPLVHFNDTCCGSVAELRSIILKARRLADDHAEQERAAVAVKDWLLAQIEKKRPARSTDIVETAAKEPLAPGRRLAA